MMRRAALSLLCAIQLAGAAGAVDAQGTDLPVDANVSAAQALFDSKDYAGAARLWQIAAAHGSAPAKLALGLMADQGFGQPRDHARAFQWYLDAGSDGLAEAQFNVAVMLDSGIGVARDPKAALVWYTRAALRGHARAQYNAALMLTRGETGPADPQAARYWFSRAAILPASRFQLDRLPAISDATERSRPDVTFQAQSPGRIELVWSGANAARYGVEVIATPDDAASYGEPLALVVTPGTGAIADFATPVPGVLWRLISFDEMGTNYQALPWQGESASGMPLGRIRIAAPPAPGAAAEFAKLLAGDLRHAGYWVRTGRVSPDTTAAEGTEVGYSYGADRALAERVASTLPMSGDVTLRQLDNGSTLPGEVVVMLAADPT